MKETVIVEGRVVVRGGEVITLDRAAVYAAAAETRAPLESLTTPSR
jgi:hypothetical protein